MTTPYQEDWERLIDDIEEEADTTRGQWSDGDEELDDELERVDEEVIKFLRSI